MPISGSRKPPVAPSVKPTLGLVHNRLGLRYRIPWIARKITIAAVIAQNSSPSAQATARPSLSVNRHEVP